MQCQMIVRVHHKYDPLNYMFILSLYIFQSFRFHRPIRKNSIEKKMNKKILKINEMITKGLVDKSIYKMKSISEMTPQQITDKITHFKKNIGKYREAMKEIEEMDVDYCCWGTDSYKYKYVIGYDFDENQNLLEELESDINYFEEQVKTLEKSLKKCK